MKKTSILIISVFIMAILTACGSSADNSQKQETIVKQPEATSMTVELDENVSETNDTAEDTKIVNNETDSVKIAVDLLFWHRKYKDYCRDVCRGNRS